MGGTSSGSASAGVRCLVRVEWPGAGSGGAAPAEPGAGSVMPQGLHGLPRQAGQAGESSCWAGVGVGCGVDGCGLMPAKPSGGMDLRVGRRWGGFLLRRDGETVDGATVGMKFSIATIIEMTVTCPVMLPRVISGLRLAISQRRFSTSSRSGFGRCCSFASCWTSCCCSVWLNFSCR
jgi:hypothetical protein